MPVFIDPVEITPGTADAWTEVDLSAYCPAGTSGVMLHFVSGAVTEPVGYRKNGSSDNRTLNLVLNTHFWSAIGVDENRVVELYLGSITTIDVYLVGYYTDDAVFFDNGVDKSLGDTNAWTDIDISSDTGTDTAIAAIFEVVNVGVSSIGWGLRKNGSSNDYRTDLLSANARSAFVIGVDEAEVCEGYITATGLDMFLVGYIVSGGTFLTDETDLSLDAADEYLDLDALPSGAIGAYIRAVSNSATYNFHLRINGSSEDFSTKASRRLCQGIIECDESLLIEGRISNTGLDFYLTGYATSAEETVKSVTDAGAGADALAQLRAALTMADTGAGGDALPGLGAGLGIDDLGSGADLLAQLGAALALADSSQGADAAPGVRVSFTLPDAGAGADLLSQLGAALALADSSQGADAAPGVNVDFTLPDVGAGADLLSQLGAALGLADSSQGSDAAPGVNVSFTLPDVGTGADLLAQLGAALGLADSSQGADAAPGVNVAFTLPDAGNAADLPSISVIFSIADTGSAADALSILQALLKSLADAGSGADGIGQISASLNVSEAGAGSESPVIGVSFVLSDDGSGADLVEIVQSFIKTVSDLAAGSDASPLVRVAFTVQDLASGVDLLAQLLAAIHVTDTATSVDAVIKTVAGVHIIAITFALTSRTVLFVLNTKTVEFDLSYPTVSFSLETQE